MSKSGVESAAFLLLLGVGGYLVAKNAGLIGRPTAQGGSNPSTSSSQQIPAGPVDLATSFFRAVSSVFDNITKVPPKSGPATT